MKKLLVLLGLGLSSYVQGSDCCQTMTEISCPCYDGGFYLDGSWVYLKPTATDADLEYGSYITLSIPPNLNALLLEIEPGYQSGYELNLGYRFPCSNQALDLSYFSLHSEDSDKKSVKLLTQIIQDFLGGNYAHSKAKAKQRVDEVDLTYRVDFLVDGCLDLQPYLGVHYADIRREFDVAYSEFIADVVPPLTDRDRNAFLTGEEKAKYWGVGPFFGMAFNLLLFCNFGITGDVGAGVLFGRAKSKVSSRSFENDSFRTFDSDDCDGRTVTELKGNLALLYSWPFNNGWGLDFEVGYRIDYYFKPIDRINPNDGYVVNANPFPVRASSNLGLGGPYVLVSLNQSLLSCFDTPLSCCPLFDWVDGCGPFFNFTSSWLDPKPTNKDLVFAIDENGKNEQVDPNTTWAGTYELGYRFCPSSDVRVSYFHLDTSDDTSVSGVLSSVNASGPAGVLFSNAKSEVNYRIDQFDGVIGKSMQVACWLNLYGSFGLRYTRLDRKLENVFLGGTPNEITDSKSPVLKSRLRGLGPVFAIEPDINFFNDFSIVGKVGLAFLVGDLKATLDQKNFGELLDSSNDLRTPKTHSIVPVFDGSIGLKYESCFFDCVSFRLEGGYEYSSYYKGVRLLLPIFLTGLNQIYSNLGLQGPYFRVGISSQF